MIKKFIRRLLGKAAPGAGAAPGLASAAPDLPAAAARRASR